MNLSKMARIPTWHISKLKMASTFNSFLPQFFCKASTNTAAFEVNRRKEAFSAVLPEIVDSFIDGYDFKDFGDINGWIKRVLYYNLNGGKLLRGLTTVMAYEVFEKPENVTDVSLRLSCVMGWCLELFHAYGLMVDDVMDRSVKRRGVACWHTLPSVGLRAVNDTVLLITAINCILKTHFRHLTQYPDMMDLINEVLLLTSAGQHLDYTMARREKDDFSKFTIDFYSIIADYKTSYTFKLPIRLGMLLANHNDRDSHTQADEICSKIAGLYQMQDDYIDVFESDSVSGKVGTDIQEGKCTWLAVTALEHCDEDQRTEFVSCYGRPEPSSIETIRRIYTDLNIPELYRREERKRYEAVVELTRNFDKSTRVTELFLKLLDYINYRRK